MVQNNKSDGARLTVNRVFGEAAAWSPKRVVSQRLSEPQLRL
jgi:hypothetical protein